jgi:hypothetical protein
MTHYIEIQDYYTSELDEANGRVDDIFPILAILRESATDLVVNILPCTCPSIAQKAWYVHDVRDNRPVKG